MTSKLLLLVVLLRAPSLFGGPLDDKTPAYFVDRYGPAKASHMESTWSFIKPRVGAVTIKGPFSIREFRQDDLRVTAVFFSPSLKLASVRLQLNHAWTAEQVEAALKAYGGAWKAGEGQFAINTWVAPDGTMAINMLTWVDFLSKEARDMVDRDIAESEAKRKAIPKF
jgi:hypothetical protein